MSDRKLDRRLGAFVTLGCALLCANNLLPYFGLRDDSCQTMFSGLSWDATSNNHLFMPQHPLGDYWEYLHEVEAEVDPPPAGERAEYLAGWLDRPDRQLNVEAVRAVVRQLCERGHRVRLSYRDRHGAHEVADACADPRLSSPSWWIPVRLYETDAPGLPP